MSSDRRRKFIQLTANRGKAINCSVSAVITTTTEAKIKFSIFILPMMGYLCYIGVVIRGKQNKTDLQLVTKDESKIKSAQFLALDAPDIEQRSKPRPFRIISSQRISFRFSVCQRSRRDVDDASPLHETFGIWT